MVSSLDLISNFDTLLQLQVRCLFNPKILGQQENRNPSCDTSSGAASCTIWLSISCHRSHTCDLSSLNVRCESADVGFALLGELFLGIPFCIPGRRRDLDPGD